ncbi:hypothetical protein RRF57_013073 [Xylaria bambusicola]|uniref:Uncharacterized protein n=1 Tax=Xylaria bambusicola TaxID=326684 RepID=A0AAN7V1A2_9PEZI
MSSIGFILLQISLKIGRLVPRDLLITDNLQKLKLAMVYYSSAAASSFRSPDTAWFFATRENGRTLSSASGAVLVRTWTWAANVGFRKMLATGREIPILRASPFTKLLKLRISREFRSHLSKTLTSGLDLLKSFDDGLVSLTFFHTRLLLALSQDEEGHKLWASGALGSSGKLYKDLLNLKSC